MKFREIFRPRSGAFAFFLSIFVWGIGVGCFMAAMNNFLSDILRMNNGQLQLGWYHIPEGEKVPTFVPDDLTKRE